jgi:hypothetical protein
LPLQNACLGLRSRKCVRVLDRLTEIPGIGEALAAVITQLHETGEHPRLEAMGEEVPAGVLDMLRQHLWILTQEVPRGAFLQRTFQSPEADAEEGVHSNQLSASRERIAGAWP